MAQFIDTNGTVRLDGTLTGAGGSQDLASVLAEGDNASGANVVGVGTLGALAATITDGGTTVAISSAGVLITAGVNPLQLGSGGGEPMGFYGVTPVQQLDIDPGSATPESIALRLIQTTLLKPD